MTQSSKDLFDTWIKIITLISSVIAFFFTIITWNKQNDIKRADFLETKIKEFEDSSTIIARSILDGFAVCDSCNNGQERITDQEMIDTGSSREGVETDIQLKNIGKTLKEKLPSANISKQRVRVSFDHLLDFFGKLEYYVELDLMTEKELNYFKYYIKRCASNDAIMNYAKENEFDLFISLCNRLNYHSKE